MDIVNVIKKESLIKIGDEPVVILTLKKWERIKEYLEELEEKERFIQAFNESRKEKGITLEELKSKYKL